MTALAACLTHDPHALRACTISRDLARFPQLIESMETHLGEAWGDIELRDAQLFLSHSVAQQLEFVILAVHAEDVADLVPLCAMIKQAKAQGLPSIIVAENLNPAMLHQLMRHGASDFIPYPLPPNGFASTLERLRNPPPAPQPIERALRKQAPAEVALKRKANKNGKLFALQGLCGGAGASTIASNLAWELSCHLEAREKRVCLLDFDLQFGTLASYLDLPSQPNILDVPQNGDLAEPSLFLDALQCFGETLYVLASPEEIIPYEAISAAGIAKIIDVALANFDYVIIDMPSSITLWTAEVLRRADKYFTLTTPEARSIRNLARFERALHDEGLPQKALCHIRNRDPDFQPQEVFAKTFSLPNGGVEVTEAGDHGEPLAEGLPKNPLRRELRKLATALSIDLSQAKHLH